jgi:cytochrome c oxidase subunit 1
MFTVGLGPYANSAFAVSTMFIAVPTGVKIFNWTATLWRGAIRFRTPLLFAVGMVAMFVIGGLSGVTHSLVPSDYEQHDTYYIVAHFHYVLFGGAMFGLFAGFYYWFPKVTGRLMNERLGKLHFWIMLIGFNVTFFPMHLLGLMGQPRRTYNYSQGMGWTSYNQLETIGSFLIAASMLVFVFNWVKSKRNGRIAGPDPWDARTLEWTIPSPPPEHNFDEIPIVKARDDFWHKKYAEDPAGRPVPVPVGAAEATAEGVHDDHEGHAGKIHMPSPSYWPVVAAAGLPLIGWGLVFGAVPIIGLGILVMLAGFYGWVFEPLAS